MAAGSASEAIAVPARRPSRSVAVSGGADRADVSVGNIDSSDSPHERRTQKK